MDLSAATFWWVAAGVVVAAELATGTFYLLMIALGLAAAAIAAHLGLASSGQIITGALVAGVATALWHWKRARAPRSAPAPRRTATSTSTSANTSRSRPGTPTAPRACSTAARRGPHACSPARRPRPASTASPRSKATGSCSNPPARADSPYTPESRRHGNRTRPGRHRRHLHLPHLQDRAAAARLGGGAPGQVRSHAHAGPEVRDPFRRAGRLQALAQRGAAGCAQPGLHHARQHAVAGRRHHLLPGHRPDARELRLEQLRVRDHPARTDAAALGDRQDGAGQDLRGARLDQRLGRQCARRGGLELGRQGAALRDQGPHAAGRDLALDAGADHAGNGEKRAITRSHSGYSSSGSNRPPSTNASFCQIQ